MFRNVNLCSWTIPKKEFASVRDQLKDGVTFCVPRNSYCKDGGAVDGGAVLVDMEMKMFTGKFVSVNKTYHFWVTNDERRQLLAQID